MRWHAVAGRLAVVIAWLMFLGGCAAGATPASSPSPTPVSVGPSTSPSMSPLSSPSASATPLPTPKPTPVPVPPKPTGVKFDEQILVSDDDAVAEITQTVTWQAPRTDGIEIKVYGVTECLAEPEDPDPGSGGPCLVEHTALPASVRTLLATAPASDGVASWTWTEQTGCDVGLENDPDGPGYHAVVLAAYSASGHSIFAIAEPGYWWRPGPYDMVC